MANKVSVPVLWNANNDFLNSTLMGVSADAYVVGVVPKPSGIGIPGYAPPDAVDTLLVKDKSLGDLYLYLSLEEWRDAISGAQGASLYVTLFDHSENAGNVGTTETDLYSDTIQGNTLGADGDKLEIVYGGLFVASAAAKIINVYFGGTDIGNLIFTCSSTLVVSTNNYWDLKITLMRVSESSIRFTGSLIVNRASGLISTYTGEITGLDLTSENLLKITAQETGVGSATNEIVATIGTVAWVSNA